MTAASTGLDDRGLNLIFREDRTHSKWRPDPVPEALLRQVYDLSRMGPTSLNSGPATAFRNSSLQGAYLIIAARALDLNCGPMSGFDKHKVNETFWPDGRLKANFLCNIGYADREPAFARNPRLAFEEASQFV